jgi:hypothetical protein
LEGIKSLRKILLAPSSTGSPAPQKCGSLFSGIFNTRARRQGPCAVSSPSLPRSKRGDDRELWTCLFGPHLWVEVLHEPFPRNALEPGYREALPRHGCSRLWPPARASEHRLHRVRQHRIPSETRPGKKRSGRTADARGRLALSAGGEPKGRCLGCVLSDRGGRTHQRWQQTASFASSAYLSPNEAVFPPASFRYSTGMC